VADDGAAQTQDPIARGLPVTLRRLRLEQGLTRRDVVERADNLSESHLAKIEQGLRSPSRKVLPGIARALGLEPPALIAMAEKEGWALLEAEGAPLDVAAETAPSRRPTRPRTLNASMVSRSPGFQEEPAADPVPGWLLRLQPLLAPYAEEQEGRLAEEVALAAGLLTRRSDALDPAHVVRLLERLFDTGHEPARVEAVLDVCLTYLQAAREGGVDADLDRLLHVAHALVRHDPATLPKVATAPTSAHHYVWTSALGRDADGGVWIDPLATAHRAGIDEADPRIHRLDDGRIRVDLSRVEELEIGVRDPARHRLRALVVRSLTPGELGLSDYEATLHRIAWSDEVAIELAPAARGTTEGEFPAGHRSVHLVTASSPAPHVLPPEENARRNAVLLADIRAAGHEWRHAVGRSVDPDQPWEESSFALLDVDRDTAVALARQHDQRTIFEWTPQDRSVVRCDAPGSLDEAVVASGWSCRWI
jgi:transcriptional regulator with XRE-family HTH domain